MLSTITELVGLAALITAAALAGLALGGAIWAVIAGLLALGAALQWVGYTVGAEQKPRRRRA